MKLLRNEIKNLEEAETNLEREFVCLKDSDSHLWWLLKTLWGLSYINALVIFKILGVYFYVEITF